LKPSTLDHETPLGRKRRAGRIVRSLLKEYPERECALRHENVFQLLVATILSAQCTDVRVNLTTPALFERFPDPQSLAAADLTEIEGYVHSLGFFRNKARSLKGLGAALIERHDGEVPSDRESLVALPGVGRKTANVILGTWFGEPAITVDTHVGRLTHKRLELTPHTDPVKIEFDLMELFPQKLWTELSHALIWHGRGPCPARKPRCESCVLSDDCPHPVRELMKG
jgi:endonuclease-3